MSRYIDADALYETLCHLWDKSDSEDFEKGVFRIIINAPSIDLADYVPKDFHDKTCEAMAKAHQEEIADMVSVVRCKECKWHDTCCRNIYEDWRDATPTDIEYCSYGEREGE